MRQRRREPPIGLREWGVQILDGLEPICALLDSDAVDRPYAAALAAQRAALAEPERTPSAQVLARMQASGENFFAYARQLSEQHRRFFGERPLPPERLSFFNDLAAQSLRKQQEIEAQNQLPFDEFLQQYFESH